MYHYCPREECTGLCCVSSFKGTHDSKLILETSLHLTELDLKIGMRKFENIFIREVSNFEFSLSVGSPVPPLQGSQKSWSSHKE